MDNDQALRDRLLADRDQVKQERAAIRRERRNMRVALLILLGSWVFGLGYLGVMVTATTHPGPSPTPMSPQFFVAAYHFLQGRVSPDGGLMFVLALMGACVTIAVGLVVAESISNRRGQVEYSEARGVLRTGATLLSIAALGTAVLVWLSLDLPHQQAAAPFTSIAALITAVFGTGIRNHLQAADHSARYGNAVDNLAALDTWREELDHRQIPRPLNGVAIVGSRKALWWRYGRGAAVRVLLLAAIPVLYLLGLLFVTRVIDVIGGRGLHVKWAPVLAGFAAAAIIAALVGFASGFLAVFRYSQLYASGRARWRLDVQPRLLRIFWTLIVVSAVVLVFVHDGTVWAIYTLGWAAAPAVTYLALRWSLTRPERRWSLWFAAPIWGMVELSLHAERERQERNRDRFFQEAKDAVAA
ncbi:Uncharacterised protein [Mycobacteroides abscessus subsp. massiliense]|uniref:hypothetical protein n=1 Tax=Mycobacteroides abscessus TaxID=36809 RepID=UPI0009A91032|nr:hypothetical protein [Mycobacteroides abscessus]SKL10430.1 Uncharacterised protein [Mycobacteroides abscessus subsp. massiliense]